MKIKLELFGASRDFSNKDHLELEIKDRSSVNDLRNEIRNFSSYHDKNWRRICICPLFPSQFGPSYANKLNDPKQSIATLAISTLLSRHFYSANLDSQFFNFMSLTYHLGGDTFNIFNSGLRRFLEYTDKNTIKDTFDIFTDEIEAVVEGELIDTTFIANKLFAKCPTKYEDEAYEESKVSFVK